MLHRHIPSDRPPSPRVGSRVLVAEDTSIHGELTRHLLERYGFKVDVVTDGTAAVEAFEASPYALVLMDCRMPSMDGYAAAKAIRRIEEQRQEARTPIVAITAFGDVTSRQRCFRVGMDDWFAKPISPDVLLQVLGRWLPDSLPNDTC